MTTQDRAAKKRARRIAADEAHSWARNLRLNNPHAKLTLSMLSLYVDGDGFCFVAIPTLAEDTELSAQTVRNRLAWLEQIGAIARLPQWIDEYGRRNGDARGKRTSDLIRLLIDADQDAIEGFSGGEAADVSREVSPIHGIGLNPEAETVSPAPALRQPYDSAEGLTSEPEPESSPKSPSRGRENAAQSVSDQIEETEPEHFGPAWLAWPGHEAMRRDLALAEFRLLTPERQLLCRAAIPLFLAVRKDIKRTMIPNFHLWIRSRGFDEFPYARLPEAAPERRWICGDELAALLIALQIADRPGLRLTEDPERGRGFWSIKPAEPDLVALARFAGEDPAGWRRLELGSAQFAAWRDRLQLWLGGEILPARVWLEDRDAYKAEMHGISANDAKFRLPKMSDCLRVPSPWPPHRDGSWSSENSEVA